MADYAVAQSDAVQGSPHLFLSDGTNVNNPGMKVRWEGPWAAGYPVVDSYDPAWAAAFLSQAL